MACRDAEIGLEKKVLGAPPSYLDVPWKNLYMNPKRKEVFMRVKKNKKTQGQVEQN